VKKALFLQANVHHSQWENKCFNAGLMQRLLTPYTVIYAPIFEEVDKKKKAFSFWK
jgi:hypothetical protein